MKLRFDENEILIASLKSWLTGMRDIAKSYDRLEMEHDVYELISKGEKLLEKVSSISSTHFTKERRCLNTQEITNKFN
jgi:hypothetical protein